MSEGRSPGTSDSPSRERRACGFNWNGNRVHTRRRRMHDTAGPTLPGIAPFGVVVWLTGLSGAGKTTLAHALAERLRRSGHPVVILDGDELRKGLCRDLGFSTSDRRENVRRVGEIGRRIAASGVHVIVALISPFRDDRDRVRQTLPEGCFIEVHVNRPLTECERRDEKGLYRRARSGALPEFTGVSSPYEPPLSPELELRTDQLSVESCIERLIDNISPKARRASQPQSP